MLPPVSKQLTDSMEIFLAFSAFSFFICWIRSGVNISSTSVLNNLPLKTSAMFVVTSVSVHLAGVLAGGVGGTFEVVLPKMFEFFFIGLFLPFDTDTDLMEGDLNGDR